VKILQKVLGGLLFLTHTVCGYITCNIAKSFRGATFFWLTLYVATSHATSSYTVQLTYKLQEIKCWCTVNMRICPRPQVYEKEEIDSIFGCRVVLQQQWQVHVKYIFQFKMQWDRVVR